MIRTTIDDLYANALIASAADDAIVDESEAAGFIDKMKRELAVEPQAGAPCQRYVLRALSLALTPADVFVRAEDGHPYELPPRDHRNSALVRTLPAADPTPGAVRLLNAYEAT